MYVPLPENIKAMLRPLVLPIRQRLRQWKILYRLPSFLASQDLVAARIEYLIHETSELRQLVRLLLARSPEYMGSMRQTAASFNKQWRDLPAGRHLPGDPIFDRECIETLCRYMGKPRAWFVDKSVLDAGCGMGRWSRALCIVGAKVTAIDISEAGLRSTANLCQSFAGFSCRQHNLLDPLPFADTQFDLVWNYGVCHHTGDTHRALGNVASGVKTGGLLFTMIYGEPRESHPSDFMEVNRYVSLRRETACLNFDQRIEFSA